MDEGKLKKILTDIEVPQPDENAKKRAVNLSVAEFKAYRQKKEKKFQGFPILSRLMGNTNQDARRDPMERTRSRKLVYGGMATAMAVVLITGVSVTQMQDFGKPVSSLEELSQTAALNKTAAKFDDDARTGSRTGAADHESLNRDLSAIGQLTNGRTMTEADKPSAPAAIVPAETSRERNEFRQQQHAGDGLKNNEPTIYNGGSALPGPTDQPVARLSLPEVEAEEQAPASRAVPKKEATVLGRLSESKQKIAGQVAGSGSVANSVIVTDEVISQTTMYKDVGRDQFEDFVVNPFKIVAEEPVSTFSVDVDTASYSFVRRQLNHGVLPQKDAVRVEEMINYFDYDYPVPESKEQPFEPTVTVVPSPWADGKQLMHVAIKGYELEGEKPRTNLVFLLDVSGSMNAPDKLPLVKQSMKMLLDSLQPDDTIAIAVYAGAAGTVLEPTKASERSTIYSALDRLSAGGSTAGAAGINLAYQLAEQNFDEEAVNRVILATDGDFNVGITNRDELKDFVERKRETGVFLSVLGFGQGNLNDHLMQELAQNGNGIAAYIDNLNEARKVLIEEASSTLFPIAKDVKIQVEFNPKTVAEYRLIGYETRALNREDFNNDKVDAGDIGAGHTVTAIYEITPVGSEARTVDSLRYTEAEQATADADFSDEYAFLKIRYKLPDEDTSKLIQTPVTSANYAEWAAACECPANAQCEPCPPAASKDVQFSVAVAGFGQLLKGGKYTQSFTYDDVIGMAQGAKDEDRFGYRAEFINLVRLAKTADTMQPR